MLFDNLAKLSNRHTWLDDLNRHVQGLSRRFNEFDRVRIRFGLIPDVVGLVQIGMVSAVVQRNIEVKNIAIEQDPLVRNAVAYYLIYRCAY